MGLNMWSKRNFTVYPAFLNEGKTSGMGLVWPHLSAVMDKLALYDHSCRAKELAS